MAYQQNIPQPTDILSQSQADILGNFQALATNGVAYATPNQLLFPSQSGDPSTATGQVALYAKSVGGSIHLFVRGQNNGTVIDLTPTL